MPTHLHEPLIIAVGLARALELLALGAIFVVGMIAAACGWVLYWTVSAHIDFRRRGYRVRQLPPREYLRWTLGPKPCVYEERCDGGTVRGLPFTRVITEDGYPAHSDLLFPGESRWDVEVPEWARGRRAEILERVGRLCGPASRIQESA